MLAARATVKMASQAPPPASGNDLRQMKRAQDKIKDFVEAQAFDEVQNYAADLPRALAAYRFTDATSDLLARWLDALANLPRGRGAAHALAGLRGVGKSHTLSAFGALAAYPELRATVADTHVGTSARRLLSRRYMVVRVDRGSRPTLLEELSVAFAATFGGGEQQWNVMPAMMLATAAGMSDAPLVVIVDTSFGHMRVRRDDGPLLSELALATEHTNAFIGLALDDDIAGADGANVALAGTFQIDYLDPEHLYRIADLHLFKKNLQARSALHDIYTTLRGVVQGFNWSEPRFATIYPVHPLVADIAPAVRLYVPTFAFLPFAAAAGVRAVSRPALSLILIDEVFDRVEQDLRRAEDLKDAFSVYDKLATEVVPQFPIMQRLQVKLALKGLFILSLDGRGATAREIGAAMLFYDEAQPTAMIERIEAMLARFAEAAPQNSLQRSEEGGEVRYRFRISASAGFDAALTAAAEQVATDDPAIRELLRALGRTRFADWPFADDGVGAHAAGDKEMEFGLIWRGTDRPGRIRWQAQEEAEAAPPQTFSAAGEPAPYDWQVVILAPGVKATNMPAVALEDSAAGQGSFGGLRSALWIPAPLSAEELESLRRLVALRTDGSLLTKFGETARAAERTHAALVERIWTRIYMDDGVLVMAGTGHRHWTDQARSASTLAESFALMLAPTFEACYPLHPIFAEILNEGVVARLVNDLFSGANPGDASLQELARLFAEPLGLVSLRGNVYAVEVGDQIFKQPWVREVLQMTDDAGGEVVPLNRVYRKLGGEPYGLVRQMQHLVLAALVAQRRVELLTASNDRISRRTLGQNIRWDEIAGVARAATLWHSAEELTEWARLLTDNQALASIADPGARTTVRAALAEWLSGWRTETVLEQFEQLPDEGLTLRAWNLAAAVRKSFGASADALEAALADRFSLEEGLQRVADAFGDSYEKFLLAAEHLTKLKSFTARLPARERARIYLATSEPTGAEQIESARRELLAIADDVHNLFDDESCQRFDRLWREFHAHYVEHYVKMHNETMGVAANRAPVEALMQGDDWRDFEALSQLSIVNQTYWEESTHLLDRLKSAHCKLPVRQLLAGRPVCDCSFRLSQAASMARTATALEEVITRGREAHRRTLALWSKHLAHALDTVAQQEPTTETGISASLLAASLARGHAPIVFSLNEVQLIEHALQRTGVPPLRVSLPADGYGLLTRDELGARLKQWLDELPSHPALVEVVSESGRDAG